jgi:hypothetical protein
MGGCSGRDNAIAVAHVVGANVAAVDFGVVAAAAAILDSRHWILVVLNSCREVVRSGRVTRALASLGTHLEGQDISTPLLLPQTTSPSPSLGLRTLDLLLQLLQRHRIVPPRINLLLAKTPVEP